MWSTTQRLVYSTKWCYVCLARQSYVCSTNKYSVFSTTQWYLCCTGHYSVCSTSQWSVCSTKQCYMCSTTLCSVWTAACSILSTVRSVQPSMSASRLWSRRELILQPDVRTGQDFPMYKHCSTVCFCGALWVLDTAGQLGPCAVELKSSLQLS